MPSSIHLYRLDQLMCFCVVFVIKVSLPHLDAPRGASYENLQPLNA